MSDNPNPTSTEQESQELPPYRVLCGSQVNLEQALNNLHKQGYRHVGSWVKFQGDYSEACVLMYRDESVEALKKLVTSLKDARAEHERKWSGVLNMFSGLANDHFDIYQDPLAGVRP